MGVYRVDFYILGFLADTARFKVRIAESRRAAVVYGSQITVRPSCPSGMTTMLKLALLSITGASAVVKHTAKICLLAAPLEA
jgi:hypothetical protein